MARKAVHVVLGIVVAAAALGAMLYSRQAQTPSSPQTSASVSLAVPQHPTSLLTFIALEKGYFAAHGLRVTTVPYPSGKRALEEGLFTGKADAAFANDVPVALAGMARNDFRILCTTLSADNPNQIVARKDHGIAVAADLKGKKIGTQKGSSVHFFLHLFLMENNLSDKDVVPVFMKAEELPAALGSGAVDAISMRDPITTQAKQMLGDKAVVFQAPGLYQQMEILVVRKDMLDRRPKVANALVQGLHDAEHFAAAHPDEAAAILAKQMSIPIGEAQAFMSSAKPEVTLHQSLLVLLETEARWAKNTGLSPNGPPDYLPLVATRCLSQIKPEGVTLIR